MTPQIQLHHGKSKQLHLHEAATKLAARLDHGRGGVKKCLEFREWLVALTRAQSMLGKQFLYEKRQSMLYLQQQTPSLGWHAAAWLGEPTAHGIRTHQPLHSEPCHLAAESGGQHRLQAHRNGGLKACSLSSSMAHLIRRVFDDWFCKKQGHRHCAK